MRLKDTPERNAGCCLWIAIAVFLANALDYTTTVVALEIGAREQNPIANFFYAQWEIQGLLWFKLVGTFLFIIFGWRRPRLSLFAICMYCAVSLSNLWVIYQILTRQM